MHKMLTRLHAKKWQRDIKKWKNAVKLARNSDQIKNSTKPDRIMVLDLDQPKDWVPDLKSKNKNNPSPGIFQIDINWIFNTDLYSFKSSNEKINSSERRRSRESLSGSRSRSTPDLILKRFRSIYSEERNWINIQLDKALYWNKLN